MIHVKNITKVYTSPVRTGKIWKDILNTQRISHEAVRDISFNIGENELVGFIGPNGAGKTTTLKMLSGILLPTSGTISVLGHTPFRKEHAFLKHIGFIMGQKNQMLWDLPATDTFAVNKAIYEIDTRSYQETLDELVSLLQCEDVIHQPVKTLSLGQRMRVEFIAALLHRPKILFLDEPTIGLDIFAQNTIREFIKEYKARHKSTIILTSHYMQDVQHLAERVILIDHGSIIFDNPLNELLRSYSQKKTVIITLTKQMKIDNVRNILGDIPYTYNYPTLTIHMSKKQLSHISNILEQCNYTDVTIENEGLEGIIRQHFSQRKN